MKWAHHEWWLYIAADEIILLATPRSSAEKDEITKSDQWREEMDSIEEIQ